MRKMMSSRNEENKTTNNNSGEVINKFSNNGYLSFNYKNSCLKAGIKRYKDSLSLFVSITNLTDENKFVKKDGKFDSGYFILNEDEITSLSYYLNKIMTEENSIDPDQITGLAFQHENKDADGNMNGSGSLFEVYKDEDQILNIEISYFTDEEITNNWSFRLISNQKNTIYSLNSSDGKEETINVKELQFKQLIDNSLSILSLGLALFEVRSNGNKNTTTTSTKNLISKKRKTLGSSNTKETKETDTSNMEELESLENLGDLLDEE